MTRLVKCADACYNCGNCRIHVKDVEKHLVRLRSSLVIENAHL
jgi:hypothetical protein